MRMGAARTRPLAASITAILKCPAAEPLTKLTDSPVLHLEVVVASPHTGPGVGKDSTFSIEMLSSIVSQER